MSKTHAWIACVFLTLGGTEATGTGRTALFARALLEARRVDKIVADGKCSYRTHAYATVTFE